MSNFPKLAPLLTVALALIGSGCASRDTKIVVHSNPPAAKATFNDTGKGKTIYTRTTPCTVWLKSGRNYLLTIEKPDYKPLEVEINSRQRTRFDDFQDTLAVSTAVVAPEQLLVLAVDPKRYPLSPTRVSAELAPIHSDKLSILGDFSTNKVVAGGIGSQKK